MRKTPNEIDTEVKGRMKELHGRTYVYKKYGRWNEMTGEVTEWMIEYRKGKMEIDPNWTKEEIRDRKIESILRKERVKELGI